MTDVIIRVENLGKRYRLGERQAYRTLREAITEAFVSPVRRLRPNVRNSHGLEPNGLERAAVDRDGTNDGYLWALRNVSFEVRRGEVIGIVGANGSGKSTLLKILTRIVKPTEGRTLVRGRLGALLEVGTGFHPELTGKENIYFSGVILGMTRTEIRARFDEIVEFAGIQTFLDTPVKHYSSGMHVRLAFAVAAQLDSDVLIVDEVLAVGDDAFQKKSIASIKSATQDGRTVLFVSHNLSSLRELCSRGILLEDGRVSLDGPIDVVLDRYAPREAAASPLS